MDMKIPNVTNYTYNERGDEVSRITKNGYNIIESMHKSYNDHNKIEIEISQNISRILNIEYKYFNDGTDSYEKIINKIGKDSGHVENTVKTYKYTPEGDWLFIYDGDYLRQAIQYKDKERKNKLIEAYYNLFNQEIVSENKIYLYRYIYNDNNQIVAIYENEKEIISVSYNENDKVDKVIIYKNPVIPSVYSILKELLAESNMFLPVNSQSGHIIHEIKYDGDKKSEHIITNINKNNREIYKRIDKYYHDRSDKTKNIMIIERSSDAGANIGRFIESKIQIIEQQGCITKYIDNEIVSKEIFDDKNNLIRYEDYHIEFFK